MICLIVEVMGAVTRLILAKEANGLSSGSILGERWVLRGLIDFPCDKIWNSNATNGFKTEEVASGITLQLRLLKSFNISCPLFQ
jgi:hypothetical protein